MRKDHFTDEALKAAYALAELKYSEAPEDQLVFAEAYDFARCQRPDGSFYGIPDGKQCKKGKAAGAAAPKASAGKAKKTRPSAGESERRSSLKKSTGRVAHFDRRIKKITAAIEKLEKAEDSQPGAKKALKRLNKMWQKMLRLREDADNRAYRKMTEKERQGRVKKVLGGSRRLLAELDV